MTLRRSQLLWLLAWAAAALGVLQLGSVPGDLGHALFGDALCGPWGWLPPLQALVALHGFWALALLPLALWAVRSWRPPGLRLVGFVLSAAGLTALVILLGRDLLSWYPAVAPAEQKYIAQRILFVLATNIDLPVVQVLVTGVILQFAGRRGGHGPSPAETKSRPGAC